MVVEVLAPVLLASGLALLREGSPMDLAGLGRSIHRAEVSRYPPHMREEYRRLWTLLHDVSERFGDSVIIHVLAPSSFRWFGVSLRHRVWHYPAFIVGGRHRIIGWDAGALTERIERSLAERSAPAGGA